MDPTRIAYYLKVRNITLCATGKIEPEENNLSMGNAVGVAFALKGWPSIKENIL